MSVQLALPLSPRRMLPRHRSVVDRLLEIVRRQGVNTDRNHGNGRVMFRPELESPHGAYIDLCSSWECLNRMNTLYTYGYGNKAEAKRLSSATHHHRSHP